MTTSTAMLDRENECRRRVAPGGQVAETRHDEGHRTAHGGVFNGERVGSTWSRRTDPASIGGLAAELPPPWRVPKSRARAGYSSGMLRKPLRDSWELEQGYGIILDPNFSLIDPDGRELL